MQSGDGSPDSAGRDSGPARAAGAPRRAPRWFVVAPLIALVGWLAYLWAVSGVLDVVEKYPDGRIRAEGYVKRVEFMGEYKPHGRWTTYHPNGQRESAGRYELGRKVGCWEYWDPSGRPVATSAGSGRR